MLLSGNSLQRTLHYVAVVLLVLLCYYLYIRPREDSAGVGIPSLTSPKTSTKVKPPCKTIPGLEDVYVIVKTGACEVKKKLPAFLESQLPCTPSYTFVSDFDEQFGKTAIHDAFGNGRISDNIVNTKDEFTLYKKLKEQHGCDHITKEDLEVPKEHRSANNGNNNSRAWVMDKWKFLPMVSQAWHSRKDAKWYFLVELDTYINWPNLMRWLAQMDSNTPYYLGSQMQIGKQLFSYGGSGTLLSQPAMQKTAEHFDENQAALEAYTANQWAGDCVLGKTLGDVGVQLMWSWPHLITRSIAETDFSGQGYGKIMWCAAVVTFHHLQPHELIEFSEFERTWTVENPDRILRHSHVFTEFLLPHFSPNKTDWDNLCEEKPKGEYPPTTFQECKTECTNKKDCFQYSFSKKDGCLLSNVIKLGRTTLPAPDSRTTSTAHQTREDGKEDEAKQSGWLMDRVNHFVQSRPPCSANDEKWQLDYHG